MASRTPGPRPPGRPQPVAVAWSGWYRPVRYAASTAFHHARPPGAVRAEHDGAMVIAMRAMDGAPSIGTAPGSSHAFLHRGADEGERTHDQQAAEREQYRAERPVEHEPLGRDGHHRHQKPAPLPCSPSP